MENSRGFGDDYPLPWLDDDFIPPPDDDSDQMASDDDIEEKGYGRRLCTMPDLARMQSEGHKLSLKFNEYGQPIGITRSKLGSMIGSTIKRCASITHSRLDDVPQSDKEKFWDIIKVIFLYHYNIYCLCF